MSFIDTARVSIAAGDGGDGHMSFRHEKFVDHGGPDGGDGGNGGDIIVVASRNQDSLASFRYQKELRAEPGSAGSKRRKHGKSGADLVVALPIGTVVNNEAGDLLADLTRDGQQVVVASGGKGGFGNAHFVSSTRQAPRIAEKGESGDAFQATFELKMIADVGLVGLPNAGKSTLLSVISNARPEIADYPFTTLTPNLGVVDVDQTTSLLFADIPGLIAGAAEGKGLGDEFLRHVERTLVLVHLIDAYQEDVAVAYSTIQAELRAYKLDLTKRPQIVALTKTEGLDEELIADLLQQLKHVVPKNTPLLAISSQAKQGIPELLRMVVTVVAQEKVKQAKKVSPKASLPVLRIETGTDTWDVTKVDKTFVVSGPKIERFARRTDFSSDAAVQRLRDIMKKMGIANELRRLGAQPSDTVTIGKTGHSISY